MRTRQARTAMRKGWEVTGGYRGDVILREFRDYHGNPKFTLGPRGATVPHVGDPRFTEAYAGDIELA